MPSSGRIIVLNGPGSAGKTAVAKELQDVTKDVFLHIEMDSFLTMLPEKTIGTEAGLRFETLLQDGKPSVAVHLGPAAKAALSAMHHAVAAMARAGHNLIVDEVMMGDAWQEYARLLLEFDVTYIGVFAALPVLEERERARGDRLIGLARWQYEQVHLGKKYHLELDTSKGSPKACAHAIKLMFDL